MKKTVAVMILIAVIFIGALAFLPDKNPVEKFGTRYGSFFTLVGLLTVIVLLQSNTLALRAQQLQETSRQQSQQLEDLARQKALESMQVQLLAVCNERYDRIWYLLWDFAVGDQASSATPEQAYAVFRRFWGIQHDQYQYFSRGFIDEPTFRYWLKSRNKDYNAREQLTIAGVTFRQGWQLVKERRAIDDDDFQKLMTLALETEDGPTAAINHFNVFIQPRTRAETPTNRRDLQGRP